MTVYILHLQGINSTDNTPGLNRLPFYFSGGRVLKTRHKRCIDDIDKRGHYICLTSLTRAKWNFPLNFRTMRKLSDLYSRIFQNSLTCAKWNFLLNFHTMHKLSDLYSGIFQTQSSGCASGVDLFRNFTKLNILNI